jgi:transcriptional regulator with GAF, ATPase, and Fis domain
MSLDEIGDTSLGIQVKFLRTLQTEEICAMGSPRQARISTASSPG